MKLGIIGCGLIGAKRADAARKCGMTVSAVTDLNAGRAEALAQKVGAQVVKDWQAMIASDVDAVNIAVMHDQLAPIAIAALKAGKHVLVEKPAGRNLAEVSDVVAAAKAAGKVVKVGFNHRFHPAMLKAKEMVVAGEVGELMYLRGRYGHGGRPGYDKEWRVQKELSGGGEMVDQGSHLIDLSRFFMGDLTLAFAATPHLYWDIAVDDNAFIALRGPRGQIAWLHATWSEWKNMFSLEIVGRDGKLTIEGLGGSYGIESLTFHKMLPQMGPPETTRWEYPFADESWVREINAFVAATQGKASNIADISDAQAVWSLIEDAYRQQG
jgi:predicted dehydrogenase